MVNTEGGPNVEDPAGFFANVFGGERFMDYVRIYYLWLMFLVDTHFVDRRDLVDEGYDQRSEYHVVRGREGRARRCGRKSRHRLHLHLRISRPTFQWATYRKTSHNFRIRSGDARAYIGFACTSLGLSRRHTQSTDPSFHISRPHSDAPSFQEALQANA